MSANAPPTVFYAKTWYLYVAALVLTFLGGFSALLGPMFLSEAIKPADGRPGTGPGIALSIMAVPLSLVAVLGWFNVYARRKPLLRICAEGLEVNVIGASNLDGVRLIPNLIRVAWLVVSLQGFKKQIGWIPWESLRNVQVRGGAVAQTLVIDATIAYPNFRREQLSAQIGNNLAFRDAEFQHPLTSIASAILAYYQQPAARAALSSLHG